MSYENTAKNLVKQTRMKPGCNASEVPKIQAMLAEGKSPLEISQAMFIRVECIESFAPAEKVAPPGMGDKQDQAVPAGAEGFAGVFRRGSRK
jgi:hypothetical protein